MKNFFSKIEDDIKTNFENFKNEDNLNFKWKTKQNLVLIFLKFWGTPFLGLAQLRKIFMSFIKRSSETINAFLYTRLA